MAASEKSTKEALNRSTEAATKSGMFGSRDSSHSGKTDTTVIKRIRTTAPMDIYEPWLTQHLQELHDAADEKGNKLVTHVESHKYIPESGAVAMNAMILFVTDIHFAREATMQTFNDSKHLQKAITDIKGLVEQTKNRNQALTAERAVLKPDANADERRAFEKLAEDLPKAHKAVALAPNPFQNSANNPGLSPS